MAINPQIPLMAQPQIDPTPGINMLGNAMKFSQQRDAQAARDEKTSQVQDAQIAAAKSKLQADGMLRPLKQAAVDSAIVLPMLESGRIDDAMKFVDSRINSLESGEFDATHSKQFRAMLETNPQQAADMAKRNIQTGAMFGFVELPGAGGNSFAQKTDLINGVLAVGVDDNGNTWAKEVGTNKRIEGQDAIDRIQKEMQAERSAELKAKQDASDIEVEETRKKELVKDSLEAANSAFETIPKVDSNISNLEEVVRLVGDGANTGPIVSAFPSIQQASIELDNLQGRLGLDVVQATTFGALSKGELDLAKGVALPTRLDGPELVDWANRKIAAQKKLRNYLSEMATFLSKGNSRAEWAAHLKAKKKADEPIGETQRIRFDAQGNRIQ